MNRRRRLLRFIFLIVMVISCSDQKVIAQIRLDSAFHTAMMKPKPGIAALEVFSINLLINRYDAWFFRDGGEYWAKVTPKSWKANLETGLEWDWNSFGTNWFGHPVHGSFFFNSARSMGMTYWQSSPYSFLGSFSWEYFGETHPPSGNDLLTTSIGGIYLGEISHRLAGKLIDYPASGFGRVWRLTLATIMNPIRVFNRWINKQPIFQNHGLPLEDLRAGFSIGHNIQLKNVNLETRGSGPFIQYEMIYGNPFESESFLRPFETFEIIAWLRFDKDDIRPYPYMNVTSTGILWGKTVLDKPKHSFVFGGFQHFDYHHDEVIEIGSLGFGAGLMVQSSLANRWLAYTTIHLGPSVLGGSNNEVVDQFATDPENRRDYILGPGFLVKTSFILEHDLMGRAIVDYKYFRFYVVSGPSGTEKLNLLTFKYSVPFWRGHRVGLDYTRYFRRVRFNDFPEYQNFMKDLYELRVFVTYEF